MMQMLNFSFVFKNRLSLVFIETSCPEFASSPVVCLFALPNYYLS